MFPYINVGQLKIPTYYTAMILGYIFMIVLMLIKARRQKYSLSPSNSVFFATMGLIFGFLGCKILFVLENINWVKDNGITFGGFSFYGAVLFIPLMMPLIGKLLNLKLRDTLDNSAICVMAMLGTIRLGCFLNGCCGGKVFNIGEIYFTFPTQLIECVCDILILSFLLKWEKRENSGGLLYPRFLLFYGSLRFFIEFLRNTDKDWLYLSHAQWFSIIAIVIGVLFESVLTKKVTKRKTA